jgi:ribonuclease-3
MKELLKKLNVNYNDIDLYERAFTHTSYAYENDETSYERLEFLGDTVVDTVLSEYLFRNTKSEEGEMTKIRASYVCENALYEYANDLEFSKYIKVGHGESHDGGTHKKAIMADVFESLIAAIYLDQGYPKAKEVVLKIILPYIKNRNIEFFSDYKSALQEAVQTTKQSVNYNLIKETGPAHDKQYTVEAKIEEIIYGTGKGKSKKEAEQEAAKEALKLLVKE